MYCVLVCTSAFLTYTFLCCLKCITATLSCRVQHRFYFLTLSIHRRVVPGVQTNGRSDTQVCRRRWRQLRQRRTNGLAPPLQQRFYLGRCHVCQTTHHTSATPPYQKLALNYQLLLLSLLLLLTN